MDVPTTRFARSADGTFIAYQVFGHGPDLLVVFPWISHLELFWEDPDVAAWLRALAGFARVITMDQRGIGLSDRMTQVIDLETKIDDVRAVLDGAESHRTTLYGQGIDGGAICAMFAATYPERTSGLLLWSGQTCGGDQADYPWSYTADETSRFLDMIADTWGDPDSVGPLLAEAGLPTKALDPVARARWAKLMRNAASRGDALIHEHVFDETDFRAVLPSIHVPAMILQREGDAGEIGAAEWAASQMPMGELTRLPADADFPPYMGDTAANLRAVRSFLEAIEHAESEFDRVLATVLFTDIVDSTRLQAELGDTGWKDLVLRHHSLVRGALARWRGIENDTAGDGFYATFDGPARAIRCALSIVQRVPELGVRIRAGIHTGECELVDGKHGGLTVSIGARVAAIAGQDEVLVSRTVKDLVAGSGLAFEDAGEHQLKGVPDRWQLYRVVA